ncbi:MAG: FMN-binding negative transcriptional regulator [Propionibacteriaceae bacterium]|jgi:transcriptional regulator|nr:FMN-binding negative transcriptional regulator [Propionibacteriaceae bacterium]
MYVPERFEMPPQDVRRRLRQIRQGNLVTVDPASGRPCASLLPWAWADGPERLLTHLGRANPQWRHDGGEALVIIDGDHATVAAEWEQDHAPDARCPGLDYETVHVWGRLRADDSQAAVFDSWERLQAAHQLGSPLDQLDRDWLERVARATVAVTIEITDVQAKSKLSQNQSSGDVERIAAGLAETCPALSQRVLEVALPHALRREAAVAAARRRAEAGQAGSD